MKRCKQGDDLIGELPDCVLGYIVSLLSIKDAIKTSVLSRRWRSIFTHRKRLEINRTDIYDQSRRKFKTVEESEAYKEEVVRRVYQLIKQFRGKNIISLKVDLRLSKKYSSHMNEWIEFAAECGVKKLELLFSFCARQYSFPYWLFMEPRTSTLEYLHLQSGLVNPPSDFRGFRHLKTLILEYLESNKDSVTNLCLTCPQLESLTLIKCNVDSNCLKITGPASLRHLRVLSCQSKLKIEVCSMDLITFEYRESNRFPELFLGEFPRLEKLYAWLFPDRVSSMLSMFQKFPHMEILSLCLYEEQVMKIPESFAILRNLKQLNLFVSSKSCEMQLYRVLSLVKSSPLLQKLVVTLCTSRWMPEDKRSDIGGQCTTLANHPQLKEFELQGCVGLSYEIEFVIHLLRMATNLETMVIGPSKQMYRGNGNWIDMIDLFGLDPSSYKSCKEWMADMLQDYIPPNLHFVML